MKFLLAFLFFINTFFFGLAQSIIRGKVVSEENGSALGSCSVFLSNTSKGTITNSSGFFELQNIPAGKHDLVISSIGYETRAITFSDKELPLELVIKLKVKVDQLATITVSPFEKDGWEKWGKVFIENFIGTTDNADDCRISNYKTIRFRFSKKDNILTAIAYEPLIIENKALGYKIQYQLEEFNVNFRNNTMLFLGYPLFEEMETGRNGLKKRWEEHRKKAYQGSIMHFVRSLYANSIQKEGFDVRRLVKQPNTEKERVKIAYRSRRIITAPQTGEKVTTIQMEAALKDSSEYYQKIMRQPDFFDIFGNDLLTADSIIIKNEDGSRLLFFNNYLHVTYKNEWEEEKYLKFIWENRRPFYQRSSLFLPDGRAVTIEPNGNFYSPQDMYSIGYWAWSEKMADMMPLDYESIVHRP